MVYKACWKKKNSWKFNSKISYMYFKTPGFWVKMGKFALYTAVGDKKSELWIFSPNFLC